MVAVKARSIEMVAPSSTVATEASGGTARRRKAEKSRMSLAVCSAAIPYTPACGRFDVNGPKATREIHSTQ